MKYLATLLLIAASIYSNAQSPTYYSKDKGLIEVKPKTDTVKGYLEYYELEKYKRSGIIEKNGTYVITLVNDSSVSKVIEPAIAIYEAVFGETPCPEGRIGCAALHFGVVKSIKKILVNGKEFDLNKHHTFIEVDKITNQP